MSKIKAWLNAARLRTLPLSISGIIVGTAIAGLYGYSNFAIGMLALVTTMGFQVTSNFANDYGDGVKGTDNKDRIGPARAYQSGLLSHKELRRGIIVSVLINLLLVVSVVYVAFGTQHMGRVLLFVFLGVASIWAAITYTVGNSAYGYKGLGDLFVFIFFGILSVMGSFYLYTKFLTASAILPAITIGCLSTGVLNLNNLRDYTSDKKAKKNTLVVKMGHANGKIYHYGLLITSFLSAIWFLILQYSFWYNCLCLVAFIPIFVHLRRVHRAHTPAVLDPELKKLALSTFLFALLFYIGFNIFL